MYADDTILLVNIEDFPQNQSGNYINDVST